MSDAKRRWYGLLTMAWLVVICIGQRGLGLIVSEVMYHPLGDGETLEFIELYNNRAVFEDLTGCAFTNGIDYAFEPGTIIGPKSHLVIARDPAALEQSYGLTGVRGPFTGRLSNDGERIDLSDGGGQIVISLRYDDDAPWPVSPDGTGHSLILSRPGGDPAEASSWSPSTFLGGTPGEPDEVQARTEEPTLLTLVDLGHIGLYFKGMTEPSPSASGRPTTAWTELDFNDNTARTPWTEGASGYGYSNESDELRFIATQINDMPGNYMSVYARLPFTLTTEAIMLFSSLRAEVHYDDGFVLYLNGTRVANSGQISGDPPAFNQSGGPATDPPAVSIDLTSRMNLLRPGKNVLAIQSHNASLSGSSDCFASPILRVAIGEPGSGGDPQARVLINELLANSDPAAGTDWIELYNPGPTTVDLSNVYLSDDRTDLLKYKVQDGTLLQPGQFWTVTEGVGRPEFGFGLNFAGETVYVTAATDDPLPAAVRVLDAVRYGTMEPEATLGRFPDGSDSFGRLRRPTFNAPNVRPLVRDIVINEIMYHHGTRDDRYEYIELYNRGATTIPLGGWAFTDGISYEFALGTEMQPDSYLVIAKDPTLLKTVYDNLFVGSNLVGPYSGRLDDHSERICLSYPFEEMNQETGDIELYMITADEVTYYEGGRWPTWADGQGASLELRDPRSNNDAPDAWADSDESDKAAWEEFSFTIDGADSSYTHDQVTIFDLMLLNRGEMFVDDLSLVGSRRNILSNPGFESAESNWRILGNHVQSFVTTADQHSGARSLHLIATGHGDPGANRINQSIGSVNAGTMTFSGWARWLRGSRFLLLRTTREQAPVQPPRPAHAFELTMPLNLGTPGEQNTAFVPNRGPDILDVQHAPVLPEAGEPIVVTACATDNDGVSTVTLYYRSEGAASFTAVLMVDDGSGGDAINADGIFTAMIPGASSGTMRAFYIEASDGSESTRFPALLEPSADVPERTCLVRVGDTSVNTRFATYRIWLSDDVISTFRSRANLSNELMDCTFVYNNTDVFYNARIRFRGSPFIRSGSGRDPRSRYAYRIDFNPEQKFRGREEINLDHTEGSDRGPLQERASYWFYAQMGLQYSSQEFVRPLVNGGDNGIYEDVQKIDGDYVNKWFSNDTEGYIHKIDDYFEYSANGTGHTNLDEGLKFDSRHPLLKETYRWGFEKRSHRDNDNWDHLFDFAVAMNTRSNTPRYEQIIEAVIHPEHFARVLAIRHAVGDWDSYGYTRGKNNYFYYALPEGKWYLLPWDIDFTLGSGNGPATNLFSISGGEFPEVNQFLNYPKYRQMYLQAFADLVNGPWQTSYGTSNPPTAFDLFLDDAADALVADGLSDGRRNGIKQFVRDRRAYILTQVPANLLNSPRR
ncbi:MAG: lamin tail domain-containing protein [Phycisphaerae bacterium]|nr:lamin tail domain-containing protein [Phycisphaerae bacterium]